MRGLDTPAAREQGKAQRPERPVKVNKQATKRNGRRRLNGMGRARRDGSVVQHCEEKEPRCDTKTLYFILCTLEGAAMRYKHALNASETEGRGVSIKYKV